MNELINELAVALYTAHSHKRALSLAKELVEKICAAERARIIKFVK